MSETMILALDGRYENFSLGRNLDINKINLISRLADKHHFRMSGFRNFERAVSSEHIEEVRHNAQMALAIHGFWYWQVNRGQLIMIAQVKYIQGF